MLDEGNIKEVLSNANTIIDDAIQKKMEGQVVQLFCMLGTLQQRVYWYTKGFKSIDNMQGDTYKNVDLLTDLRSYSNFKPNRNIIYSRNSIF